jgi:uncharacterized protein
MLTSQHAESQPTRHLPVAALVALVVVYLVLIQGVGYLMTRGLDMQYAAPTTVDEVWRGMLIPVSLSVALVYAVVAWLRWWRPVWVDDRPVQRWLIVVPILMIASILIVTDYSGLAAHGVAFTALLLLTCLLVGLGEETMFRGIAVTCFRTNNFSERRVALWSTVIFGLAHATNIISEGPKAFVQVLATIIAGYFFYILRRRTRGLLVPVIVHGLWDFSLISGQTTPGQTHPITMLAILTMIVLAIILFIRRHHIEPTDTGRQTPANAMQRP